MSNKKVSVRLVMEGGKVVEAELQNIGNKGAAAMGRVTQAADGMGAGMGRVGGAVQNAGYQLTDLIVQIDGGTDVFRALGQQMPQILGPLGMFGAVAGVAVAALAPLIRMMFEGQDPIQAFTDDLKALEGALASLRSSNSAVAADVKDLVEKYGEFAGQAREVLEIQRQLAEARANRAFDASAASAADVFGGGLSEFSAQELQAYALKLQEVRAQQVALAQEEAAFGQITTQQQADAYEALMARKAANDVAMAQMINYREEIRELAVEFGISEQAAARMAVAAAQVREADNTADRVEAARALSALIYDVSNGMGKSSEEAMALYESLNTAVLAGLEFQKLDMTSPISGAVEETNLLISRLIAAQSIQPGMTVGKPLERPMNEAGFPVVGPLMPPLPNEIARGGGGGGGSRANDQASEALRIFEATRTEAERYNAEQAKLKALMDANAISADTYSRAMDQLAEKYEVGGSAMKFFEQQNDSFKESFLDLMTTGENTFDRIAKAIKRAAVEALLFNSGPLAGMFGGFGGGGAATGGGGLFGFVSGLFGGFRAKGGPVSAGRAYVVGENEPEVFVPNSNGLILPSLRGLGGGTAVQVNVNLSVDARGAGAGDGPSLGAQILQKIEPAIRQMAVSAVADANRRGRG